MFVIFDRREKSYIGVYWSPVNDWRYAKPFKTLDAAISPYSGAGLMNANRVRMSDHMVVHELSDSGKILREIEAPAVYKLRAVN